MTGTQWHKCDFCLSAHCVVVCLQSGQQLNFRTEPTAQGTKQASGWPIFYQSSSASVPKKRVFDAQP